MPCGTSNPSCWIMPDPYLKALEPEEWHNEQEKARQLMPYKLPAKLVEYLKTGPLRLEFPEWELVKWAELYPYMDVQEMTWKRKKLLSLMAKMDNYSDYLLLWSPRDKKLWYLDIEHEEFHPLAKWEHISRIRREAKWNRHTAPQFSGAAEKRLI